MVKSVYLKRIQLKVLILLICLLAIPSISCAAKESKQESKIIVSLGDSFSSGEGIEPFYGQEENIKKRVNNPDWLAHRSKKAWPGKLRLPSVDGTMAENREKGNDNWYFVAASGATTQNIRYNFEKKYDKKGKEGSFFLDPQLAVFDKLEKNTADYVTLTLGGNDAGFSDIIGKCAGSYLNINGLNDKLNSTWENFYSDGGIRDKLYDAYTAIAQKAGSQAKIIVAGYPKLINADGGFVFSKKGAELVNTNVSKFNKAIKNIVLKLQKSGMNISFVSVEDAFEGHGAYSSDSYIKAICPLVNKLNQTELTQDLSGEGWVSAYSMHPNEKGADAYARCVQAEIDKLEDIKFNTRLTLAVYDCNDDIYGDYIVKIEGKEFIDPFKWGLIGKSYSDKIVVNEVGKLKFSIPEGDYSITVIDGADEKRFCRKEVKIRSNAKNEEINFQTDFDKKIQDNEKNQPEKSDSQNNIPEGAAEYNGHYYYLYVADEASSYERALQYCNTQGGYLATVTSQEENDFLLSYMKSQGCESAYFGFSDADEEGVWTWNNGEKAEYTNWHNNEPNGENPNEDYALFYYKYADGTWNDGDFGERTVNGGTAFICEWGEYEVASQIKEPVRTASDEQDIVLVLDKSGSMYGTPMQETKKASAGFIETVLEKDAGIGIVTYDGLAERISDFSVDKDSLKTAVSGLDEGGETNIESGLAEAETMLGASSAKKKIIVLMSDGEPNVGKTGDALIAYANEIRKSGILIYTLGFFESLDGNKSSAQVLMEQIASDGCHYEVANADDLVFFFGDIADQLNGQKYIYVRIACPVDVSVTCQGQTLSSSEDDLNLRTDFGTLSFEESEKTDQNEADDEADDRIKVLRLKEGTDYDLKIAGTGRGLMDYTIGFMDDEGNYSDFRKFENVKITKNTLIDTVAATEEKSTLNIDENGDGKYDLKLSAGKNGYGEEVKIERWIYYAVFAAAILILFDIIVIILRKAYKRKER